MLEGFSSDVVTYSPSASLEEIVDLIHINMDQWAAQEMRVERLIFITDGAPGELRLGDHVITMEDIDDLATDAAAQQFQRLGELMYSYPDTWLADTSHTPYALHLWGSEIAKGVDGEAFVDRIAELTQTSSGKQLSVRASDDLSGGHRWDAVNSDMFASFSPGADWELEYLDQYANPSNVLGTVAKGMDLYTSAQGQLYENYYILGRWEVVAEGNYTWRTNDNCEAGILDHTFSHDSLEGAYLRKVDLKGEADLDCNTVYLDWTNFWLPNGKIASQEWVEVTVETGQTFFFQNDLNYDQYLETPKYDSFSHTMDLNGVFDETSDGTFKVTAHFGDECELNDYQIDWMSQDAQGYKSQGSWKKNADNYFEATLYWNPAPEQIADLHVQVKEHTSGISVLITNEFLVDYEGIAGYDILGYDTNLFANVAASSTGVTFDTLVVTDDTTGGIAFRATDEQGVCRDYQFIIDVAKKADAVPFDESGDALLNIAVDDWAVTDHQGTVFDARQIKITDLPDDGQLYLGGWNAGLNPPGLDLRLERRPECLLPERVRVRGYRYAGVCGCLHGRRRDSLQCRSGSGYLCRGAAARDYRDGIRRSAYSDRCLEYGHSGH